MPEISNDLIQQNILYSVTFHSRNKILPQAMRPGAFVDRGTEDYKKIPSFTVIISLLNLTLTSNLPFPEIFVWFICLLTKNNSQNFLSSMAPDKFLIINQKPQFFVLRISYIIVTIIKHKKASELLVLMCNVYSFIKRKKIRKERRT